MDVTGRSCGSSWQNISDLHSHLVVEWLKFLSLLLMKSRLERICFSDVAFLVKSTELLVPYIFLGLTEWYIAA